MRRPGPYRWGAVRVDAAVRLHQHGAVRLLPRLRRLARSNGPASSRWTRWPVASASTRSRCADATSSGPASRCGPGGKPLDADLIGDIEKVAAALGWDDAKAAGHRARASRSGLLAAGAHPVSSAVVRMEADGDVVVLVGSTEIGQGQRTAFAQIAGGGPGACRRSGSRCQGTDTRFTPYDRSTGASRSTTLAGLAVLRAADAVRPTCSTSRPSSGPARVPEHRAARRRRPGAATSSAPTLSSSPGGSGCRGGQLIGEGGVHPEGTGSYAEGPVFWEVCIGAAEVRVDRETGALTVTRTATVADVGKAINPQLVERQDEGATMQGIGNALFEEMVFSEGVLLNDDLLEYRVPNTEDLPARSTCVIVENGDGPGPVRRQGVRRGRIRRHHRRARDRGGRRRRADA